jgi:acyl-CoA synthetase (AMP-forming)/AMP-acid ligase II
MKIRCRVLLHGGTHNVFLSRSVESTAVMGEIAIRSPYVALGYWHKPELTRAAFLPDPHWESQRLYRTGDMGRFRPDGRLEFVGRKDQQVKMHGFRIELGEIEAALSQHPDIQEAVVLAREDVPGDKRLVAYVVPREQELVPSQLRTFLRQQLPAYMVPAAFVTLDRLPQTPSGKLDRRALPAPARDRSAAGETYTPARTPIEAELVQIWTDILGVAQVSVYDNFFALGGHSLLATRVIARIDYAFAIQLPSRPSSRPPLWRI